MLFLEVAPQAKLIGALVVLLMVLISCISAKRFNFLHGTIVFFTLLSLLAGVDQILITKGIVETNPVAQNVSDHLNVLSVIALPIYQGITGVLENQAFYPKIEQYMYLIYFAPIALWFVSRVFAGIFRKNRRRY